MSTLHPRILLTSLLFITPCFSSPSPSPLPTLYPRQDVETRIIESLTSSVELQGGATTVIPSPTTPYRLETATAPIQLADTIGLIMPNPWAKIYAGESASARDMANEKDLIIRLDLWMSFLARHRLLEVG
jgi:hypothetical protein